MLSFAMGSGLDGRNPSYALSDIATESLNNRINVIARPAGPRQSRAQRVAEDEIATSFHSSR